MVTYKCEENGDGVEGVVSCASREITRTPSRRKQTTDVQRGPVLSANVILLAAPSGDTLVRIVTQLRPYGVVHSSWFDLLTDPVRLTLVHSLCVLEEPTAAELVSHSHASDPTLRRHLEALVTLGLAREHGGESDGLTRGRPAARFSLDPDVREAATALFEILAEPIGSEPRRTPWPGPAR